MRYKADITAGSLKVSESRVIADLLLCGINRGEWDEAILDKNVLQARSPETARRLTRLIRRRLLNGPPQETGKGAGQARETTG